MNLDIKKHLLTFSSILIYLIPFALLTGAFFPDLFLVLSCLITLYIIIKERQFIYFKNNFFIFFTIFLIVLILSSILSQDIFFSLKSSLVYFRFGIFALAIWFLIENQKNFIKNFIIIFFITYSIALFDGYFQYINGQSIFGVADINNHVRLNLLLNDKLILGGYLARLFPLLMALIIFNFESKNKFYYFAIGALIILTDTLVYMSGERTALGLMFLTTLFIIFFMNKLRLLRILTFFISIGIIVTISINNPSIKERNIDETFKQIGIDDNKKNLFSPVHERYYKGSWNMFKDFPIFGIGPNNFRRFCGDKKYAVVERVDFACSTHPHNTYIQLAAETGLSGLLVIIIFLNYLCIKIIRHFLSLFKNNKNRLTDYQICLLGCFFLTLWPIMPTHNFFNNWINIIYYLPVGFYLHSIYSSKIE